MFKNLLKLTLLITIYYNVGFSTTDSNNSKTEINSNIELENKVHENKINHELNNKDTKDKMKKMPKINNK